MVLLLSLSRKVVPQKDVHLKKGTLFDLLPTGIINDIDIWLIGLEYSVKLKAAVMRINIPHNPVPHMHAYND